MRRIHWLILAAIALLSFGSASRSQAGETPVVNSVTDIAHEFTFYFDGRFAANYLPGGSDARCWATLHKYDLANANLLILQSGASPCPYLPKDIASVRAFLNSGGGVAILGDCAIFPGESKYRLNELAHAFGCEFTEDKAAEPLAYVGKSTDEKITNYGAKTLALQRPGDWTTLIADSSGKPVAALRKVGKGRLLIASRSLAGRQPDAKDPINAAWWTPTLQDLASGKRVDPNRPPQDMQAENVSDHDGLKLRYTDYLKPYADAVLDIFAKSRPELQHILGVPPSKNMLTSLILLPTGGGGFSDGRNIALGVWWGNFPTERYGMVELLGHESTHSWVLPFAEPMWNEGIATYIGIMLGRKLGYGRDADASLKSWLDSALKLDPDMTKYNIASEEGLPHAISMAKPMWIFEQLRKEHPDIMARYFQAKRKLADPAKMSRYTADDSVAVLSVAAGKDLFPWFQSLGIDVDKSRTKIEMQVP